MANTQGFDVVIQSSKPVIVKALKGAWKSAECEIDPGDEGRIPEYQDLPPGIVIGGYTIADGQAQVLQNELDGNFDTGVPLTAGGTSGGAELIIGMNIQLHLQNPPVPSAGLLTFHTFLHARAPISTLPDTQDVGLLLADMPRSNVWAQLDGGDPLAPLVDTLMQEFLHRAYENGALVPPVVPFIPHFVDQNGQVFTTPAGNVICNVHMEIFDDEANPARQIIVTRPTPATIKISIPVYLRLFNVVDQIPVINLKSPMGVETRIEITAPFETPPGTYRARFTAATAATTALTPAGPDIAPAVEGQNFTDNDSATFGNLKTSLETQLATRGLAMATALGDLEFTVPTAPEIETVIADFFYADLVARSYIALWTPTASDAAFHVDNVTVGVQAGAMNIAINSGAGANVGALSNFIPGPNEFAIALSQSSTQKKIDDAIVASGFNTLPKRFREDDKDVDLRSLNVALVDHAIRMTGSVTVIDAILGSIDVDANFQVDVGLHWNPDGTLNAAGGQNLDHHIIGDPDVDTDEGIAFWIIAIILTVISFGAGGVVIGIIAVIIVFVVKAIVESIGSDMLVNGVTGAIDGITAWPPNLSRIGRVRAVFNDPVDISTSGLVIAGTLEVISSCEATTIAAAKTAGAYSTNAAQPLALQAQRVYSNSEYFWNPGDGTPQQALRDLNHAYLQSGVYIAKHGLRVLDPGGAASRHFARVKVRNVPPTVDAGPDIEINEGEEVLLEGTFEDVEYLDTHVAIWNFGDNRPVEVGSVVETNTPPKAVGKTRIKHAWCDQGVYTVILQIIDMNGGVGTDRRTVRVLNVPPQVICPAIQYAYACSPITLVAHFIDPGWCDTHTAIWHFGDCTEDLMAEVKETNTAPAAKGTASASHIYGKCGSYYAVCTVIDDDGGIGTGVLRLEVVHLINPKFEQGFTYHPAGHVANGWTAFWKANDVEGVPSPLAGYQEVSHVALPGARGDIFFCERCLVYEGRRSQRIQAGGAFTAGIFQRIGANPEWDYQVSVMYQIPPGVQGTVKLGLDPTGGGNPYSTNIKWVSGKKQGAWSNLTVPITAIGNELSVWISLESEKGGSECCVDAVEFIAIQNKKCPPCTPQWPRRECIEFQYVDRENLLPPVYEREGIKFITMDRGQNRLILSINFGNRYGLEIRKGEIIELNGSVNKVTMEFDVAKEAEVIVIANDAGGKVIAKVKQRVTAVDSQVEVNAKGIIRLQVATEPIISLLRICVDPTAVIVPEEPPRHPDTTDKTHMDDYNKLRDHLLESSGADTVALYREPDHPERLAVKIFTEGKSTLRLDQLPNTQVIKEIEKPHSHGGIT